MSGFPGPPPDPGENARAGVVIVAAGQSSRMQGVDKVLMPLLEFPLLAHTVGVFQDIPQVDAIVLVVSRRSLVVGQELVEEHGFSKVRSVCAGGARRQDSVRRGLAQLPRSPWVIVHDGARPCIEPAVVIRGLHEAVRWGSAVAAVPVKDTIKVVTGTGAIETTPPRENLWATQTPQIFPMDVLEEAHRVETGDATDDASLVERAGYRVHVYFGSYQNIKVTTRDDGLLAELLLRRRKEKA